MAQQLVAAIALGSVYVLFALGMSLCWGVLNLLNLAHGALFVAGVFGSYMLVQAVGSLPFWLLLILGGLVSGVLAALMQILVFGPIRRHSSTEEDVELRTLIAGVALGGALIAAVATLTRHQPFGLPAEILPVEVYDLFGLRVNNVQIITLIATLVLSAALIFYTRKARDGRALRAIATDRTASAISGIPVARLQVQALALSGALAGIGGVLLAAYLGSVDAHTGDQLLLKAFAIIIMAGVGSLGGAVIFGFVLAFVEVFVAYFIGNEARDAIAFAVIILVLLFRPQGFLARPIGERA